MSSNSPKYRSTRVIEKGVNLYSGDLGIDSILSPTIQSISIGTNLIIAKSIGGKVFEIQINNDLYKLSNFESYDIFYDNISQTLTDLYLENSYAGNETTYTSYYYGEGIIYTKYGKHRPKSNLQEKNGQNFEDAQKFFFGYFRYFVLGSGRKIPEIKMLDKTSQGQQIFFVDIQDFEYSNIKSGKKGLLEKVNTYFLEMHNAVFEPLETEKQFPNLANYLIYLISIFEDIHDNKLIYFEYIRRFFVKYIHSFSQEEILKIYQAIFEKGGFCLGMFSTEFNKPDLLLSILTSSLLENNNSLEENYVTIQNMLEDTLYKETFSKICALYFWDFPLGKEVNSTWFILYYLGKNGCIDSDFPGFLTKVQLFLEQDGYKITSNNTGTLEVTKPDTIIKGVGMSRIVGNLTKISTEERLALFVLNPKTPQIETTTRQIDFKPRHTIAPPSISIILPTNTNKVILHTNKNASGNTMNIGSGIRKIIKVQIHDISQETIDKVKIKWNSLLLGFNITHFPIGGKIHFSESIDEDQLRPLTSYFGFGQTPFKLLHANTSLCLPPCSSPYQLIAIIYKLTELGILQGDNLELQLSLPGRLPNDLAGVLGSAMIFLKNYQTSFGEDSFSTSHNDQTMTCMMCYDAGVLDRSGFSTIPDNCNGRTDILGLKKIEEVMNYFIVGNLVNQSYFGGIQRDKGKKFVEQYITLLKKYGIDVILKKKWIHNPNISAKKQGSYQEHSEAVKTCTDILNSDIQRVIDTGERTGLIFEVKNLLQNFGNVNDQLDLGSISPLLVENK